MADTQTQLTSFQFLDITGLGHFWTKVKAYVDTNEASVVVTPVDGADADKNLITVTKDSSSNKYTIDYSKLATAIEGIKASAGVTGLKHEDDANGLVNVSVAGTPDGGVQKGDVTVSVNTSALQTRLESIEGDISSLSGAVNTINGAYVKSVAGDSDNTYVNVTANNADGAVTLVVDEAALSGKIDEMVGNITAAQNAADAAQADATAANTAITNIKGTGYTEDITLKGLSDAIGTINSAYVKSVAGDEDNTYVKVAANNVAGAVTLVVDESKLSTDLATMAGNITAAQNSADAANTAITNIKGVGYTDGITLKSLSDAISALSATTDFLGKFDTLEDAKAAVKENGDIVIVGNKEYIYFEAEDAFIELGDTTAESQRISALEAWATGCSAISTADIDKLFTPTA